MEALCQKTKLFCGPWGRLLQYPQLRTYQKSVKSVVLYSDSPHSFHIRSTFVPHFVPNSSTILFDFDGIPMASQAFSMWISTTVHGSLVSLVFCSRFLASCRCLTSMLHRQKMISLLPNDVNLPGWRKIPPDPRLSFSSFQHSPGLTPMTTSFALETLNLHPLTFPSGRINHTRHTPITGSNVLSSWSS